MKKNLLLCNSICTKMEELGRDLIEDADVLFEIVEQETGISEKQIRSKSRKRHIVEARMIMAEALRRNSKYKLWEIGRVVSDVDHSSVIHYKNVVKDLCENQKSFRDKFLKVNVNFGQIKNNGLPLNKKLEFAIRERDRLNKEIRKIKKLLKL